MRTESYKPITKAQIRKINALLNQKGLTDMKRDYICQYSNGRTCHTKELTCYEAKRWITDLCGNDNEQDKQLAVFNAIYKLAWSMGMIYGETDEDYEMNKAKLNQFCRERGAVKKNLTSMNLSELRKMHKQFEAMYSKKKK